MDLHSLRGKPEGAFEIGGDPIHMWCMHAPMAHTSLAFECRGNSGGWYAAVPQKLFLPSQVIW